MPKNIETDLELFRPFQIIIQIRPIKVKNLIIQPKSFVDDDNIAHLSALDYARWFDWAKTQIKKETKPNG